MSKHARKRRLWPVVATAVVLAIATGSGTALVGGSGQSALAGDATHDAAVPRTADPAVSATAVYACATSAWPRKLFDESATRHRCPDGWDQVWWWWYRHRHRPQPSPSPSTTSPSASFPVTTGHRCRSGIGPPHVRVHRPAWNPAFFRGRATTGGKARSLALAFRREPARMACSQSNSFAAGNSARGTVHARNGVSHRLISRAGSD